MRTDNIENANSVAQKLRNKADTLSGDWDDLFWQKDPP